MSFFGMRVRGIRDIPGVGVVAVTGPIDARCADLLQRELAAARTRGYHLFVLDLENVRYINSAGLSGLVNLSDVLGTGGDALHLAGAQPKVRIAFEMMGLTGLFRLHPSVWAAVRHIQAGRGAAPPEGPRLRLRLPGA